MVHGFLAFLFAFLFTTVSYSQECVGGRNILIVDRTSKLNGSEKRSLEDGVEAMFANPNFIGELMIGELRGKSLSSDWIDEICVASGRGPSIVCETIFEQDVGKKSFSKDPIAWIKDLAFGSDRREVSQTERLTCEQERNDLEAQREKSKATALAAVLEITEREVPSSKTALAETVFRVTTSRCTKKPCKLYIFSNLLDDDWQAVVEDSSDPVSLGRSRVQEAPRFDASRVMVTQVVAWGFGFDELDGERKEQLSEKVAQKLERYWKAFFKEISDGDVVVEFEMPQ